MFATVASIGVALQPALWNTVQIKIAGYARFDAERQHHLAPFVTVWFDTTASKKTVHDVVRDFMGHGLGEILLKIARKDPGVIANFGSAVPNPEHACTAPAQIKGYIHIADRNVEKPLGRFNIVPGQVRYLPSLVLVEQRGATGCWIGDGQ